MGGKPGLLCGGHEDSCQLPCMDEWLMSGAAGAGGVRVVEVVPALAERTTMGAGPSSGIRKLLLLATVLPPV